MSSPGTLNIPYDFDPNTPALASEVNANFAELETYINSAYILENNIGTLLGTINWSLPSGGSSNAFSILNAGYGSATLFTQSAILNASNAVIKITDTAAESNAATAAEFFINCTSASNTIPNIRLDNASGSSGKAIQVNYNSVEKFSVDKATGNMTSAGTISAAIFALPTGVTMGYPGKISNGAPAGWVFVYGRTLGNASSGATERANADCAALFTFIWNNSSNSDCPVSGGRGASATADFAANKTITMAGGAGYFKRIGSTDTPWHAEADATAVNGLSAGQVPHGHTTNIECCGSNAGNTAKVSSGDFTFPTPTAFVSSSTAPAITVSSTDSETRPMNFYENEIIKL